MNIFNHPFVAGTSFASVMLGIKYLSVLKGTNLDIGQIGPMTFLTFFPCAMLLLYLKHLQNNRANPQLLKLILCGFKFIFGAALIFSIAHFINASYINPLWGQESLSAAKLEWAAKNYSEVEIAGQIEFTDTFQNPFKWSLVIFAFYSIAYGLIHLILSTISFLFWKKWQANKHTS